MIHFAIMGHGVVGSGVAEVFFKNKEKLEAKLGEELNLKYVLDLREFPGLAYSDRFTKDFQVILQDPEVSIVAELMGGLHPSYEFVKSCLENGKSVVTSNKELVAEKGAELLAIAERNHINFLFEASVGGGIPIIRPLHQCLAANEIKAIAGILNGTTNFILTKMIHDHMSFGDALSLAQKLGYAERDPSADVDGHDSCRKISILASLAFGQHVYPKNVYTEGIRNIDLVDVQYAASWGGVIKLVGEAKRLPGKDTIKCLVSPALIHKESQLANIDDVFNGVLVRGNATGDVVFYGKGAGKLPTASAVVADVIHEAKSFGTSTSLTWADSSENFVEPVEALCEAFYVRLFGASRTQIEEAFGAVQFLSRAGADAEESAFVIKPQPVQKTLDALKALEDAGVRVCAKIRVADC